MGGLFGLEILKMRQNVRIQMNIHVKKNLKIQVRKYLAFDLAFLTFVDLFKILLRSLRCKKSGGMQESCTLAFYHQKQFSLKISHFESVCIAQLVLEIRVVKVESWKEMSDLLSKLTTKINLQNLQP